MVPYFTFFSIFWNKLSFDFVWCSLFWSLMTSIKSCVACATTVCTYDGYKFLTSLITKRDQYFWKTNLLFRHLNNITRVIRVVAVIKTKRKRRPFWICLNISTKQFEWSLPEAEKVEWDKFFDFFLSYHCLWRMQFRSLLKFFYRSFRPIFHQF